MKRSSIERQLAACVLSILALAGTFYAMPPDPQERVTLATPAFVDAGVQEFALASVTFNWQDAWISVTLRPSTNGVIPPGSGPGNNARQIVVGYDGATATALMVALNKANLSVKSLNTRILERLRDDGKLPSAGTVSGVPK